MTSGPVSRGEIVEWSIDEIARRVRTRDVRAIDVVDAFLARIALANAKLNAIIEVHADAARTAAADLDARLDQGESVGPLGGVPFTVKDVFATEAGHTTAGSLILRDNRAGRDATVVSRLRAAGAILLGKTNTPEFAMWIQTSNRLFGTTRSPIGESLPGGSSGGEAAAVSARMSAFGIGTDFGGSIRWPAHCTGIVGLRPTPGLMPLTGFVPGFERDGRSLADPASMLARVAVVGILAKSVDDAEAVLRVAQGPDDWDSLSRPSPAAGSRQVQLDRLHVTWTIAKSLMPVDPEIRQALLRARDALAAGVSRMTAFPEEVLVDCLGVYNQLRQLEPLSEIRRVSRGREAELTDRIRQLLERPMDDHPIHHGERWADREAQRARFLAVMGDVVLLPVAATCAWPDDGPDPIRVDGASIERGAISGFLRATSLVGVPVVAVPVGRSSGGLPIGIQVVARPDREDVALAVARQLSGTLAAPLVDRR